MTTIRVVTGPGSARLYIHGRRVHHGAVGLGLIALGVLALRPALIVAGGVAAWHDRRDWPFPLLDRT